MVPGGQQIYALPSGLVGFTQPHSAFQPMGSLPCPFAHYQEEGVPYGRLKANVFGARELVACPTREDGWQMYLSVSQQSAPTGDPNDCIIFEALTLESSHIAAWEYT
jgi:hypothetical protein